MIERQYKFSKDNYIELLKACPVPAENVLLLDIETTGLSKANNHIYIIGLGRLIKESKTQDNNESYSLHITQYFSESNEDEVNILTAFSNYIQQDDIIITFNGNRFDIPFLSARLKKYNLNPIDNHELLDLYKTAKSMSGLINLPNYKQTTVEEYLGIHRDDAYSGLELINVYKNYIKRSNSDGLSALLLHNMEDVKGMLDLFSLFSYSRQYNNYLDEISITVKDFAENEYTAFNGSKSRECLISFETSNTFPVSLSVNATHLFFRLKKKEGHLSLKIFTGELCHYIEDYKNYYYLPLEGTVVHKDLAIFVDKNHREKATKDNCCIKKDSSFIPVYLDNLTYKNKKLPIFKENPKSKDLYIEYNNDYFKDLDFAQEYIYSILLFLCKEK